MASVTNLVYYGYEYQRFKIDEEYADNYMDEWHKEEVKHAWLKPVIIVVGCAMMLAGAYAMVMSPMVAGATALVAVPTFMFGLDMVTGNTLGFSVLDEALKGALYAGFSVAGRDTSFIKAGHQFSFFQFTSSSAANLVLTQLTFMAVGGVLSGGNMFRQVLRHSVAEVGAEASEIVQSAVSGGLRQVVYRELAETANAWARLGGSIRSGLAMLSEGGHVMSFLKSYLAESIKHLGLGAAFLFTLGAVGTVFGDGGLFAELALQGIILTSVLLSIKSTHYHAYNPTSWQNLQEAISNRVSRSRLRPLFAVPGIKGIATLKAMFSIMGAAGGGAAASMLALQMAQHSFEAAVVIGRLMT